MLLTTEGTENTEGHDLYALAIVVLSTKLVAHNCPIESHRLPHQGRTIAIQVLARREVKHVAPEVPYVVVSIANPHVPHPTLAESSHRLGVLRIAFDDIEATRRDFRGEKLPMTPTHAREIREFVEAHLEGAELIVIHCDAGMCRSPAVAAALWRWLEGTRGPFFELYRPNPHVYRTMMDALH